MAKGKDMGCGHDKVVTRLVEYTGRAMRDRMGVLGRGRSLPRPGLHSVSRDCTVALNGIVPYRIEYKEAEQAQDDEDQYTDVYKSPDRDSR